MLKKLDKQKGFTIVEVMIVLAIAGVIMLVVFLAVPALQRNSRNSQRRADVGHLASLVNEYASANQGSLPTAYATGTGSTAGTMYLNNDKFNLMESGAAPANPTSTIPGTLPTTLDKMYTYTTALCSGNSPTSTGATARNAVIYYLVETAGGNVGQCQSI